MRWYLAALGPNSPLFGHCCPQKIPATLQNQSEREILYFCSVIRNKQEIGVRKVTLSHNTGRLSTAPLLTHTLSPPYSLDNSPAEILWHIISASKAPDWYVTVAVSDSSPLKCWECVCVWGAGSGGWRVDPFDTSPAGYLTGAVSEARGGWRLSIKHPFYLPLLTFMSWGGLRGWRDRNGRHGAGGGGGGRVAMCINSS